MEIKIDHSAPKWYPFEYEGAWVRHKDCGGKMWWTSINDIGGYKTACDCCEPGFRNEQLELELDEK